MYGLNKAGTRGRKEDKGSFRVALELTLLME